MAKNLYRNVCAKDDRRFPLTREIVRDVSFIERRTIPLFKFDRIKSTRKRRGLYKLYGVYAVL